MDQNQPSLLGDSTAQISDISEIPVNPVNELGSGDMCYDANFLTESEANLLFDKLKNINFQQWHHMPDKKHKLLPLSRLKIALADSMNSGETLLTPHYRFPVNSQNSHGVYELNHFPELKALQEKINQKTGYKFNHSVVLIYRDGTDCIGFHKDKTLDLEPDTPIVSISLGQPRSYLLRDQIRNPTQTQRLILGNGSLLLLGPRTNESWYHSIPSDPMVTSPRISITFRVVNTFINKKTGEISGKGSEFTSVDWPIELKGSHLRYPNELIDFWLGNKTEYRGSLWWHGIHPTNMLCKTIEQTDKYLSDMWKPTLDMYYNLTLEDSHPLKFWFDEIYGIDGYVAMLILFDQISRNVFRGQEKAFAYDKLAIQLAKRIIELNPPNIWYRYFAYVTMVHSEDVKMVSDGVYGTMCLTQEISDEKTKDAVKKTAKVFQEHLDVIKRFGRYPHRNKLLGRSSTVQEIDFLTSKHLSRWMRVERPIGKIDKPVEKTTDKPMDKLIKISDKKVVTKLRILVLHSNRQTGQIFKNKTDKYLEKALYEYAELTYADAPHIYKPAGEAQRIIEQSEYQDVPNVGYTRTWWNASDDPQTMIYHGMEESIKYINSCFNNTQYDGIIGFSQGGTLAGIICMLCNAKKQGLELPSDINIDFIIRSLKFCAIISGFYCRDIRYAKYITSTQPRVHVPDEVNILTDSILIPSFHTWGLDDKLVDPWRSEKLSQAFKNKTVTIHPSGHFAKAIKYWPIQSLKDWLGGFISTQPKYKDIDKYLMIETHYPGYVFDGTDEEIDDFVKWKLDLKLSSDKFYEFLDTLYGVSDDSEDFDNIYQNMYRILSNFPIYWEQLIQMDTDNFNDKFRKLLVKLIGDKLKSEYIKYYMNHEPGIPSILCDKSPRYNLLYRESKLHSDIASYLAQQINIFDSTKSNISEDDEKRQKLLSYNQYHKIMSRLCKILHPPESKPMPKKHVPRTNLDKLMAAPLDPLILNPRAEPVDISVPELLKPLYDYLENKADNICEKNADVEFIRGTVCADGRLDLCKQVIGPIGVMDQISELKFDSLLETPKVKHLLLGNNICGNELGKQIAKFIASGKSALTTWYIAGNDMDVDGIRDLCEVLATDKQVKQLWLKRNPLRAQSIPPIINMLSHNTMLEVLDLTNTGLMDEGAINLISNLNQTLQYLYLSSNGLTSKTCEVVASHLHKSNLKQIGLGCNRLGDMGAKYIADMLMHPECKLLALEIASDGISHVGAQYIAKALETNRTLVSLNMGFLKSTNDLKEVPNIIGSEGGIAFAKALETNNTLRHLDLTYTGIQQAGIERLAKTLTNYVSGLISINIEQFGIPHNELSRELIRKAVQKNKQQISAEDIQSIESIIYPKHLEEIKSVYRVR
jgi:uncharacterized protein (DUF924 family)/Ran GTPase-activating protein (RanGAP) involved in mRNA processing and transport